MVQITFAFFWRSACLVDFADTFASWPSGSCDGDASFSFVTPNSSTCAFGLTATNASECEREMSGVSTCEWLGDTDDNFLLTIIAVCVGVLVLAGIGVLIGVLVKRQRARAEVDIDGKTIVCATPKGCPASPKIYGCCCCLKDDDSRATGCLLATTSVLLLVVVYVGLVSPTITERTITSPVIVTPLAILSAIAVSTFVIAVVAAVDLAKIRARRNRSSSCSCCVDSNGAPMIYCCCGCFDNVKAKTTACMVVSGLMGFGSLIAVVVYSVLLALEVSIPGAISTSTAAQYSGIMEVALLAAVLIVCVAVFLAACQHWQRVLAALSGRRNETLELLQTFSSKEDLAASVLTPGSVDFGPKSPCVASGGGGRIYKCTVTSTVNSRLQLQQVVALKEIFSTLDLADPLSGLEEFAKEMVVLMALRHANIVSFMGLYFHQELANDGTPVQRYFMVMQFAENGSLDAYVEQDFVEGPTLVRRQAWVCQVARALQYLHNQGFVHRDIKPQNVLLDASWSCLLADFGIARSLTATGKLTTQIGTVQFMPPEALSGLSSRGSQHKNVHSELASPMLQGDDDTVPAKLADAQAWDTYSFAMLVVGMFGQSAVPFPYMDERIVVAEVLYNRVRPERPTVLSAKYYSLLQSMWSEDPAQRPNFNDLVNILEEFDNAGDAFSEEGQRWTSEEVPEHNAGCSVKAVTISVDVAGHSPLNEQGAVST